MTDERIKRFMDQVRELSTQKREFFVKLYLDNRPENGDIEETPTIKYLRQQNEILQEIKKNTGPLPALARVFRNVWAKGAGDMDEYVLKK